jgi:hypothetical protein
MTVTTCVLLLYGIPSFFARLPPPRFRALFPLPRGTGDHKILQWSQVSVHGRSLMLEAMQQLLDLMPRTTRLDVPSTAGGQALQIRA